MPEINIATAEDLRALESNLLGALDDIRKQLDSVTVTPPPQLMTIKEYAAFVGRDARTVRRWIDNGTVQSERVGNVTMVRR